MASRPRSIRGAIAAAVAIAWALFQLSLPSFLILDSIATRAIHLAFALAVLWIAMPAGRGLPRAAKRLVERLTPLPVALAGAAVSATVALYTTVNWKSLALRSGAPTTLDLVFGIVVVALVLDGARRAIGPALTVIALLFICYAFAGPYLPAVLAFKGVSVTKFVTQISLSSEGIYGIPLGVSAEIVFLFVLMGALMEKAGAGQFFIQLALSILGQFRGGPAKAAVVASGLMGSISGSSIANIVTTGTFTIPLMKKVGYPAKKAAAIEVASSTDGQLMPPIMGAAAFIIAEYVNVPYIEVVKAAFIPAFVSYCALFYITHLEAVKLGLKRMPRQELPRPGDVLRRGWLFLVPPFFLVFELLILRHSAQRSVFAAILVLLPIAVYEQWRKGRREQLRSNARAVARRCGRMLSEACVAASRNMVAVALATAGAGIIVGTMNMGIGSMITQIVETLSGGNVFALLLITAVASLLLGMGLPTTATYIVMASLTAPVLATVGARYGMEIPLMAAHLFCFYFGILADDTPPVGLASYAAAALAESEPIPTGIQGFLYDLRTTIIPFMFIFNSQLILHGVHSWLYGIWILITAILASVMFTSAIQGWFVRKNRWYETPLFVAGALVLFNPGIAAHLSGGLLAEWTGYAIGIGVALLLAAWHMRTPSPD